MSDVGQGDFKEIDQSLWYSVWLLFISGAAFLVDTDDGNIIDPLSKAVKLISVLTPASRMLTYADVGLEISILRSGNQFSYHRSLTDRDSPNVQLAESETDQIPLVILRLKH